MANEDVLKLPVEIPWKLAATTQPLSTGEPDETTISMFYFMPKDEEIADHYPDERLVYLKVAVSVSPAAFPETAPPTAIPSARRERHSGSARLLRPRGG